MTNTNPHSELIERALHDLREEAERLSIDAQMADPSQNGMRLRAMMGRGAATMFQTFEAIQSLCDGIQHAIECIDRGVPNHARDSLRTLVGEGRSSG